jgi:hypothetical protein
VAYHQACHQEGQHQVVAVGLDLGAAAGKMAKKQEPIAHRHHREAAVPASSGDRQEAEVLASSGDRHEAHQGLEAVETCWEAVRPGVEAEIPYPVRVELLDQELVGAENALEQEAAERRTCIAYHISHSNSNER